VGYITPEDRVIVNNEWDRIRKETVAALMRFYPSFCLEGLQNTTETVLMWAFGPRFKEGRPEQKGGGAAHSFHELKLM
jgi:hypothetical protein